MAPFLLAARVDAASSGPVKAPTADEVGRYLATFGCCQLCLLNFEWGSNVKTTRGMMQVAVSKICESCTDAIDEHITGANQN